MPYRIIKRTFNSRGELLASEKLGEAVREDQARELINSLNNARTFEEKRRQDYRVEKVIK